MGRPLRIIVPNLPFHIINRGNARQAVFRDKEDFEYYLQLIKRYKKEFKFKLFHFVLMPNHVHFLMEPTTEGSVSKIMHRMTLAHKWYFNKKYYSVGHVWQGRFKSSLIDKEDYFLHCGLYIELNPVRAKLVKKAEDWKYSSYEFYAFGRYSPLIEDILDIDPFYFELGKDDNERQMNYRDNVQKVIEESFLETIRADLDKGVFGDNKFVQEMKEKFKICSSQGRGRPKKK